MNLIPLKQLITKLELLILNFLPKLTKQGTLVHPQIDEESSIFSFFSKPIMQLGCRGAKKASAVTPEGFLYTGAIELTFFTGIPLKLINQRIKTLYDGYYPLICYNVNDLEEKIVYSFKIFQYWLQDPLKSPPINHVLISIKNNSKISKNCSFGVGVVKPKGNHRPDGDFINSGLRQTPFNEWKYSINGKEVYCDERLVYMTDQSPDIKWKFKNTLYKVPFNNKSSKKACCIFQFDINLKPDEIKSIYLKVPHYPIPKTKTKIIEDLRTTNWDEAFKRFKKEWKELLNEGMQIELPERKVIDTYRTSLMFNLMCQEFKDDKIIQKVNRFQYNKFWIRDASFFSRMFGIFGRKEIVKGVLLNFLEYQDEKGNFLSQSGQLDGWGQTLWAFGEYLKLYKDLEFAKTIFPYVLKAIEWLKSHLKNGLMPSTNAFDNEMIIGMYTGHNFWTLHGLDGAIFLAHFLNDDEHVEEFKQIYRNLKNRLIKYLRILTKDSKIIPPGLEFKIGIDWSNLLMIYPTKILDPKDPLTQNTLNYYRKHKMKEGLSTWGPYLHHYVTERIAISELILNHQRRVLNDFYSMLLHTGSCNEGFEMAIFPWGNRDYECRLGPIKAMSNYPPHGWFACNYNVLLRMMLIREEDDNLHLISALSPQWLQPGSKISVENAQTRFGIINFDIHSENDGFKLHFNANWDDKPTKIIIHRPFFVKIKKYFVNETKFNFNMGDLIELEPNNFSLKIKWESIPENLINYDSMVDQYKRNYRKIYELVIS